MNIGAGRRQAPLLSEAELHQKRVQNARLLNAAGKALERSRMMLSGSQSMLILTDPQGLIVATEGDRRVIDHGRENHLEPGGSWHEDQMGTNAIGTALAERAAVQIHGKEHFCSGAQGWTCAAVPIIHSANGRVLGAVDVSSRAVSFNPQSMALAASIGHEIERELDRLLRMEHEQLLRHFLTMRVDTMLQDTLVLDRHGALVHTTKEPGQRGVWEESGMHELVQQCAMHDWQAELQRRHVQAEIELVQQDGEDIGAVVFLSRASSYRKRQGGLSGNAAGAGPMVGVSRSRAVRAFDEVRGESEPIVQARELALNLAGAGLPILVEGETGTGKELFARAVHRSSRGEGQPFVPVNCGGIARDLIASELFGYSKGSFTGADERGRTGKIVAAHGGTLCLDEIGEMPMELQPYLLRVLEDGIVYPIGSQQGRRVDISLVSMTNRSLLGEIAQGRFRRDLYYRIAAATVRIPPLRERGEDVLLLAEHFAWQAAERLGRPVPSLAQEAVEMLLAYAWPGNVRQLRNVMDMAVALVSDGVIRRENLPAELWDGGDRLLVSGAEMHDGPGLSDMQHLLRGRWLADGGSASVPMSELWVPAVREAPMTGRALKPVAADTQARTLRQSQREAIVAAIEASRGNMTEAARRLGIARSTLYVRLNEYGISRG
ncbi:MAG: sigma 54-interacting transcriptional regulator [Lautropia sp.]|nr:sigma 54-interacting transcriptional regulator [Lautropia sp.]